MTDRKNYRLLIPELQHRFLFFVLLCGGISVVLSACLSSWNLSRLALELPTDGELVVDRIPGLLVSNLIVALAIVLPIFGVLAAMASMPFFGALFKMRGFLEGVADGSVSEPCTLRSKDPLHAVCGLLNEATAAQRALNSETNDAAGAGREAA